MQVGETYHASRELRYLWENDLDQRQQTWCCCPHAYGRLSFRTADILRREQSQHWYAALYPIPDFDTGDAIRSQALLLAVMRQIRSIRGHGHGRGRADAVNAFNGSVHCP